MAYRFSVVEIRQTWNSCGGRTRRLPPGDIRDGCGPAIWGGASTMATVKPLGREGMRSPRWDVKQSTCAVLAATRSSSLSTAGMKTVTLKSRCVYASGSPWGCSPPSSPPLCGGVMTCREHLGARVPSRDVAQKVDCGVPITGRYDLAGYGPYE